MLKNEEAALRLGMIGREEYCQKIKIWGKTTKRSFKKRSMFNKFC